jgi:hypothetical protein
MNCLILSTLPRLLSVAPLLPYVPLLHRYILTILCSTTLSVLYHVTGEANPWITTMDYGVAFLWAAYDLHLGLTYTSLWDFGMILCLNGASMLLNVCVSHNHTYVVHHSLWYLVNAAKCYRVAQILASGLEETVKGGGFGAGTG